VHPWTPSSNPDWEALAAPDMWIRLGLALVLLVASAFFSGSEVAPFSLSRVDLQQLRRKLGGLRAALTAPGQGVQLSPISS